MSRYIIIRRILFIISLLLLFISAASVLNTFGANIIANINLDDSFQQEAIITNIYGGEGYQEAYSTIITPDGGYALAGYTRPTAAATSDMCLVKTDSTGQLNWSHAYGYENDTETAYSIVATSDGGYALVGTTESYGSGYFDIWLVKANVNGLMEWHQTFGGIDNDGAKSVIVTTDGGFILAGYTYSYGNGDSDMWLVKTDSKGRLEWNKTIGGVFSDRAESIIQTSDGGYIIAGYSESYTADGIDMLLVKTNSTGDVEWRQLFGEEYTDKAYSVVATPDGGYALVGISTSWTSGSDPYPQEDMLLIKTNATGHEEWNRTFGGEDWDGAHSIIVTADGGYALAGYTYTYLIGEYDMWLVKTNVTGHEEWNQTFGGTSWDMAYSVVATPDGGYALAGYVWSTSTDTPDMCIVMTTLEENTYYIFSIPNPSKTSSISLVFLLISFLMLITYYKRKKKK